MSLSDTEMDISNSSRGGQRTKPCTDHTGPMDPCLPERPVEPDPSDCCGSGCSPCVYDIYDEDVKRWEQECIRIRTGLVNHEPASSTQEGLTKVEYRQLKLLTISKVTNNTNLYRFSLPGHQSLGEVPAQHLMLRAFIDGRQVVRKYTPVSPPRECGYFDVLIKLYNDGKMSSYVCTWNEGDLIDWRGPFGGFSYKPNKFRSIGMLAAGTGITPMATIISEILNNEDDETRITLLYACKRYNDILLKPSLEEWSAFWNFKVIYALSQESAEQKCGRYGEHILYDCIGKHHVAELMPQPSKNTMILVCGTKEFDKDMMRILNELGHEPNQLFKF